MNYNAYAASQHARQKRRSKNIFHDFAIVFLNVTPLKTGVRKLCFKIHWMPAFETVT